MFYLINQPKSSFSRSFKGMSRNHTESPPQPPSADTAGSYPQPPPANTGPSSRWEYIANGYYIHPLLGETETSRPAFSREQALAANAALEELVRRRGSINHLQEMRSDIPMSPVDPSQHMDGARLVKMVRVMRSQAFKRAHPTPDARLRAIRRLALKKAPPVPGIRDRIWDSSSRAYDLAYGHPDFKAIVHRAIDRAIGEARRKQVESRQRQIASSRTRRGGTRRHRKKRGQKVERRGRCHRSISRRRTRARGGWRAGSRCGVDASRKKN